jgi:hypothetical protein
LRSAIRSEGTTASLFSDTQMNAAIQDKIKSIPKELGEQRHIARATIPRLLAQVIHSKPQLIAAGTHEFHNGATQFKVLTLK